jgi:hypothetical protein
MRLDFEELQYIVGGEETIRNMPSLKPMRPFSEEAVGFLSSLSKRVLHSGKDLPDAATFGFWCRKAALLNEKARYDDLDKRLGKGLVFTARLPMCRSTSLSALPPVCWRGTRISSGFPPGFSAGYPVCGHINELLSGEFKEMAAIRMHGEIPPRIRKYRTLFRVYATAASYGAATALLPICANRR